MKNSNQNSSNPISDHDKMSKMAQVLYPSRYPPFHQHHGHPYHPTSSVRQPNTPHVHASKSCQGWMSHEPRFTPLLLEHGEIEIQDWAVTASSFSSSAPSPQKQNSHSLHPTSTKNSKESRNDSSQYNTNENSTSGNRNSKSITNQHGQTASTDTSLCMDMKNIQGRLRLCTKSIVFEPYDTSKGIIRCPFDRMLSCPTLWNKNSQDRTSHRNENKNKSQKMKPEFDTWESDANQIELTLSSKENHETTWSKSKICFSTRKYYIMKTNHIVAPYQNIHTVTEFHFLFLYSNPSLFLSFLQTLYDSIQKPTLSSSIHSTTSRNNKNGTISSSGHKSHDSTNTSSLTNHTIRTLSTSFVSHIRQPFDSSNLHHIWEIPKSQNLSCTFIQPLLQKPGCCFITNEFLYFQPWRGNDSASMLLLRYLQQVDSQNHQSSVHAHSSSTHDNITTNQMEDSALFDASFVHFDEYTSTASVTTSSSTPTMMDDPSFPSCVDGSFLGPKAMSWEISSIVATARRYHGLRDIAVEFFFPQGPSILLAFQSMKEREWVLKIIHSLHSSLHGELPCHTDRTFLQDAYQGWMVGTIDNFEYLLLLNSAAGRTFQDLSRYPVFPWVLSDYTSEKLDPGFSWTSIRMHHGNKDEPPSTHPRGVDNAVETERTLKVFRDLKKPVGALLKTRLDYFQSRYESMQDMEHPFLYGTHYSAPGYVLYYLVRAMPEHMLCLQNGKFDSPDRLFYALDHCFSSLLTNPADVKECIPHFFDPQCFDFLLNIRSLPLGCTQTGIRVNDIKLPPWAKSAKDFLQKNRMALESDYCSKRLHFWIDLIFGEKSRGPKALDALNLFHPTAYLGPKDLEKMKNEEERKQSELQATEFGIVPDMLFCGPHPSRTEKNTVKAGDYVFIADLSSRQLVFPEEEAEVKDTWEVLNNPSRTSTNNNKSMNLPRSNQLKESVTDVNGNSESAHRVDLNNMSRQSGQQSNNSEDSRMSMNDAVNIKVKGDMYDNGMNDDDHLSSVDSIRVAPDETVIKPSTSRLQTMAKPQPLSPVRTKLSSPVRTKLSLRSESDIKSSKRSDGTFIDGSKSDNPFNSNIDWQSQRQNRSLVTDLTPATPENSRTVAQSTNLVTPKSTEQYPPVDWEMKPIINAKKIHNDALSGCVVTLGATAENYFITSTSLDGTLMVHTLASSALSSLSSVRNDTSETSKRRSFVPPFASRIPVYTSASKSSIAGTFQEFRSHASSDPFSSLAVVSDECGGHIAFAGGHDDVVLAYGIQSGCALASVYSHRDAVTGVTLIKCPAFYKDAYNVNCTHIMVTGSWDATVKIWSVSIVGSESVTIDRRVPILELFDADTSIVTIAAIDVAGASVLIAVGCSDGSFLVWSWNTKEGKNLIYKEEARRGSGPCTSVLWHSNPSSSLSSFSEEAILLFVGLGNGRVISYSIQKNVLRPESKLNIGSSVQCLCLIDGDRPNNYFLFAGCADGGLRLIPVGIGGHFDYNPRLWKSFNGNDSPRLTCLHVAKITSSIFPEHSKKVSMPLGELYICAVGAGDGTLTICEIKEIPTLPQLQEA